MSQGERDVVSFSFLLPVGLWSRRLVVNPHLSAEIVAADSPLLQVLDDRLPCFLQEQGELGERLFGVSTFQLDKAPFLWQALVLSLLLITITPLSVGPSWTSEDESLVLIKLDLTAIE